MTSIPFDPTQRLLIFDCRITYQTAHTFHMALDTGATSIVISEAAATLIGFDLDQVTSRTTFSDASQSHLVPVVSLNSLSIGGVTVENIDALCYTLPEEHGIDGVIGLNFLRQFKRVILDFEQGLLILQKNNIANP